MSRNFFELLGWVSTLFLQSRVGGGLDHCCSVQSLTKSRDKHWMPIMSIYLDSKHFKCYNWDHLHWLTWASDLAFLTAFFEDIRPVERPNTFLVIAGSSCDLDEVFSPKLLFTALTASSLNHGYSQAALHFTARGGVARTLLLWPSFYRSTLVIFALSARSLSYQGWLYRFWPGGDRSPSPAYLLQSSSVKSWVCLAWWKTRT